MIRINSFRLAAVSGLIYLAILIAFLTIDHQVDLEYYGRKVAGRMYLSTLQTYLSFIGLGFLVNLVGVVVFIFRKVKAIKTTEKIGLILNILMSILVGSYLGQILF